MCGIRGRAFRRRIRAIFTGLTGKRTQREKDKFRAVKSRNAATPVPPVIPKIGR